MSLSMNEFEWCNAAICDAVVDGSCVMLIDDKIVYAGPIKDSPNATGKMVLLSPTDFEKLKEHVNRGRH